MGEFCDWSHNKERKLRDQSFKFILIWLNNFPHLSNDNFPLTYGGMRQLRAWKLEDSVLSIKLQHTKDIKKCKLFFCHNLNIKKCIKLAWKNYLKCLGCNW